MSNVTGESETAFTPGPWVVKRSGTIASRDTGDVIATCGYRVAVGSDEDDANTRLIASAPELFAALQAAQKRLGQIDDNSPDAVATRMQIGGALERAVL